MLFYLNKVIDENLKNIANWSGNKQRFDIFLINAGINYSAK